MRAQQKIIAVPLLVGVTLATLCVLMGAMSYLLAHGNETLPLAKLNNDSWKMSVHQLFQFAFSFTPLGYIELGLLILIYTQIIRVALLAWFYAKLGDKWFTWISLFITVILIYSNFY